MHVEGTEQLDDAAADAGCAHDSHGLAEVSDRFRRQPRDLAGVVGSGVKLLEFQYLLVRQDDHGERVFGDRQGVRGGGVGDLDAGLENVVGDDAADAAGGVGDEAEVG